MNYQQITFFTDDHTQQELLIALLEGLGFEGFEERDDRLIATIPEADYSQEDIAMLATEQGVRFSAELIPPQNWNAIWEAGFEPVVVSDFCTVRAAFHPPAANTAHEIIITPKMSFGTGHHATTQLMMEGMRSIDFSEKDVLDFGTGTGILAILAKMLGAASVEAIDNDEWSVTNATENAAMNHTEMSIAQASIEDIAASRYDVILANINRNILLRYMDTMSGRLKSGGVLLVSGILTEDEPAIVAAAQQCGLTLNEARDRNNWMSISFLRQ